MAKRIIYQNNFGGVSVIIPATNTMTVKQIAAKDVPTGKPYKIVNESEVPSNRTSRDKWVVDVADLTDGVGE